MRRSKREQNSTKLGESHSHREKVKTQGTGGRLTSTCANQRRGRALVAHAYNPSYSEGRDQEDHVSKPVQLRPCLERVAQKRAGGVAQGVSPEFKPQYHKTNKHKKNQRGEVTKIKNRNKKTMIDKQEIGGKPLRKIQICTKKKHGGLETSTAYRDHLFLVFHYLRLF
jgi:hypothetical protein